MYKHKKLVKGSCGFMELRDIVQDDWREQYAILNFSGELATSTEAFDALFEDRAQALEYVKYLDKQACCKDVWVEKVLVRGNEIKIPLNGDLTLPEDKKCAKLALMLLGFALGVLGKAPYTGGCRTFYTPAEWKARNEEFGLKSELIVFNEEV